MTVSSLDQIVSYHEQTKHRPERYARSLGFMEWSSQPCIFRSYGGSERVHLDYHLRDGGLLFDELLDGAAATPAAVDHAAISSFLRDSLALSAWKQMGSRNWTLRVVPSSGNLHPTEAYLLLPPAAGIADDAGLYHYAPYEHALEQRRAIAPATWQEAMGELPTGSFLVGLTSIFWRESWKYGERAFRYCQHDLGHVIAALDLAARLQGWHVRLQRISSRGFLNRLLAIDGQDGPEAEAAVCLLAVVPIDGRDVVKDPQREALEALTSGPLSGEANRLSPHHHDWPIIDQVAAATDGADDQAGASCPAVVRRCAAADQGELRACSARQIIHQRRSAAAFDDSLSMPRAQAMRFWRRLLVAETPFWEELLPWPCCVSLVIQVHRVDDLATGTYCLVRDAAHEAPLRALFKKASWEAIDDPILGPGRLFLLRNGDVGQEAAAIACEQRLAGDACFTIGLLADFERMLGTGHPAAYAQMFWECGAIGQICYLEAEAAGFRGCGLGCYIDDGLLNSLGATSGAWQDLYHFAVGAPVDDGRLRTADPYIHRYTDEELAAEDR